MRQPHLPFSTITPCSWPSSFSSASSYCDRPHRWPITFCPSAVPLVCSLCSHVPQFNGVSAIWDADYRRRVFEQKMTTHELCTLRNRHVLIPGQRCPFEDSLQPVPVLLLHRPGIAGSQRLGYGSGWDVLVPAGYGISTWMCLVMWGAKPGALRETETIYREASTEEFIPDTLTAQINDQQLAEDLREK